MKVATDMGEEKGRKERDKKSRGEKNIAMSAVDGNKARTTQMMLSSPNFSLPFSLLLLLSLSLCVQVFLMSKEHDGITSALSLLHSSLFPRLYARPVFTHAAMDGL